MRKFFLIVMMFLLPHQYAWAMAANYDVHDTDHHNTDNISVAGHNSPEQHRAHFGHHEHHANIQDAEGNVVAVIDSGLINLDDDVKSQSLDSNSKQSHHTHVHYGFCHLSCGEVLTYRLPVFEATSIQFLSQYSLVYQAPTSNTPYRPKWLPLT